MFKSIFVLLLLSTQAVAAGIPPSNNFGVPIPTVFVADTPKLNVAQALSLLSALRNLDGHQVIIKQNGQDVTVMQPWDFGSGLLRLKIANDITILAAVEKAADDARQATIKELMKDKPAGYSIQTDQSALEEFGRQYAEILNQPAKGSDDLARIKASELKLEKNEIPVTALSALQPILEMDVSLK